MTRRAVTVSWGEATAKVNLALAVTGRRPDGYHELRSVFLRLVLHDHLEVRRAADPAAPDRLDIDGDPVLATPDNLVLRAAAALRATLRTAAGVMPDGGSGGGPDLGAALVCPSLSIRLHKHIPHAAGLGGGSADAAATLGLAAQAWGLAADDGRPAAIAARLGSDVPFFAAGHAAALVTGVGDVIDALPAPTSQAGILLVTPAQRLSTAAVFAAHDALASPGDPAAAAPAAGVMAAAPSAAVTAVDRLATLLRAGLDGPGLAGQGASLRDANDLWAAACHCSPGLADARDELERCLGQPVLLTGSGPTLVAVYPSPGAAGAAAADLEASRPAALEGATINATASATSGGSS